MAGDWIKMRADLQTHPKVVRISSALKADRLRVVGGLHAVWCLFDAHSEDGNLSGYTLDAVDDLLGFPGFAGAMCAVKWLILEQDGIALPEFEEHNGQSAKRRATETKRKRLDREDAAEKQPRKLSASDADKKRTREEKRREDISTTTVVDGENVAKPRPSRKCPTDFIVTTEMASWAAATTPSVDADAATAKFRDHTFKTTITDWPGAWRNWLRRDQEYAESRRSTRAASDGKYAAAAAAIFDGATHV